MPAGTCSAATRAARRPSAVEFSTEAAFRTEGCVNRSPSLKTGARRSHDYDDRLEFMVILKQKLNVLKIAKVETTSKLKIDARYGVAPAR